jgi:hypothetical protein
MPTCSISYTHIEVRMSRASFAKKGYRHKSLAPRLDTIYYQTTAILTPELKVHAPINHHAAESAVVVMVVVVVQEHCTHARKYLSYLP